VTPFGAVIRGLVSGAAGTLAMDISRYVRYRLKGGDERFLDWELSAGLDSWEKAPAPAQLGRRVVEGVFQREVPPQRAALVNNVMHWGYGTLWGAQYGIAAGSLRGRPTLALGVPFGTVVWGSDYVVLPLAGLYEPVWEYEPKVLADDLATHWVYGLGTAAVFRALSR
jgi:hypothetical protein